jgi:hypothetical protein
LKHVSYKSRGLKSKNKVPGGVFFFFFPWGLLFGGGDNGQLLPASSQCHPSFCSCAVFSLLHWMKKYWNLCSCYQIVLHTEGHFRKEVYLCQLGGSLQINEQENEQWQMMVRMQIKGNSHSLLVGMWIRTVILKKCKASSEAETRSVIGPSNPTTIR